MKKMIITSLLSFSLSMAFSQTKRIAHYSHSGAAGTFDLRGTDNFGLEDPRKPTKPKKDSSKVKTDTLKIKIDTLKVKHDTLIARPKPVALKPKVKVKSQVRPADHA